MLRSNVLRLRNRASAAAWRNFRRYSSRYSQNLPVTIEEFQNALNSMGGLSPLGFAISGGVDSMALASLFARSKVSNPFNVHNMPVYAFIVDHKVRSGSTEEAEWVAEQCRIKFGMQASVLPLTWPAHVDPLDHKRFESDARTLRYQALGRACRAAGVKTLMVAHHADDQAETVLMRLANNRLRSGLQAMQPVEGIPECHGIYGVSHSGDRGLRPFPRGYSYEDGGIRILRPLLSFDKSRLIATCEDHDVNWVEDKTNHLQTYTLRNAVRHILKNHKLPAALSIESLVDVSKHMQERVNAHKSRARRLLSWCRLYHNPQVGSLHVQLPSFQKILDQNADWSMHGDHPIDTPNRSELNDAKNTAICLLAQVGQFVSPRENPSPGGLASAVDHVWPEFRNLDLSDSSQEGETETEVKTSFCVHGIWWRKDGSHSIHHPESSHNATSPRHVGPVWLLTRQPLAINRPESALGSFLYPPLHALPITQVALGQEKSRVGPDWQLFDGRWWVSIQNHTPDTLILRHFTKADLDLMKPLAVARRGGPEKYIAIALSLLKPADVRFTLPALFQRDTATKKETLIGFPTLNVSMGSLGYPKNICSWRVAYKKLGNEVQHPLSSLDDLHVKCTLTTHAMIEKELAKFDKTYRRISPTRFSPKSRPVHGSVDDEQLEIAHPGPENMTPRKQRTVPLVPTADFERRGRSEKRKGGGYDIKWKEFDKRFE